MSRLWNTLSDILLYINPYISHISERPYNDILYIIVYVNHYLSKTVEDQAVLPHHDRGHQSPHTQHIVGLGGRDTGISCNGNFVS